MAPDLINSHDAKELVSLARKIQQYQESKDVNDSALLRKFSGLGSTKTFNRILNNDLEELDLERQLANYRAVWAIIESLGDEETRNEELYDDLSPVLHLKRALLETMRSTGNNRLVVMEGDTGTGKSSARRLLIEKYGQRLLWIEATSVWKDNSSALLSTILHAKGTKQIPQNSTDRLALVISKFNETRICLIIDEGHHLGPNCLNTLKTLINQTQGEFILLVMPTLWKRMEQGAYEEVRQLVGNRLAERIKLDGLRETDVAKFINRRVANVDPATLKQAIRMILDRAARYGNMAFVRDVCERVAEQCEGTSGPSLDIWSSAIAEEVKSR
jgi:type II secretory pathway predicted ATPase ExeA